MSAGSTVQYSRIILARETIWEMNARQQQIATDSKSGTENLGRGCAIRLRRSCHDSRAGLAHYGFRGAPVEGLLVLWLFIIRSFKKRLRRLHVSVKWREALAL